MKKLAEQIRENIAQRQKNRRLATALTAIAGIMVFITVYTLILPALALEKEAYCGKEAHEHTDACYTQVLNCDKAEHTHNKDCYDDNGNLICKIQEHQHSSSCYKKELTCGKERHVHTEACYERPAEAQSTGIRTQNEEAKSVKVSEKKKTEETTNTQKDNEESEDAKKAEDISDAADDAVEAEAVPSDLSQYLTEDTGLWYYRSSDKENASWNEVRRDTELQQKDLVCVHLALQFKKGTVTDDMGESVYELPDNIEFTDVIAQWLNDDNHGMNQMILGKATPDNSSKSQDSYAGKYEVSHNEATDKWELTVEWDDNIISENARKNVDVWADMYITGKALKTMDNGANKVIFTEKNINDKKIAALYAGVVDAENEDGVETGLEHSGEIALSEYLTGSTGLWYYRPSNKETASWNLVRENTMLKEKDLVCMHLAFQFKEGTVNTETYESIYELPDNIEFTDVIASWLNDPNHGMNQIIMGKATPDNPVKEDDSLAGTYTIAQNEETGAWEMLVTWEPRMIGQNLILDVDVWADLYITGKAINPLDDGSNEIIFSYKNQSGKEISTIYAGIEKEAGSESEDAQENIMDQGTTNTQEESSREIYTMEEETEETTEAAQVAAAAPETATETAPEAAAGQETATQAESAPEATTEANGDAAKAAPAEEQYSEGTLTYEGKDFTVTASYGADARLPEGVKLDVREIRENSSDKTEQKEFQDYYKQAESAIQENNGSITGARFFDITFVDGQKEIEPSAPISVKIEYKKAETLEQNEDVVAVHLPEKADNEVLNDVEVQKSGDAVKEVEFTAESFSVYGVIYTVDYEFEVNGQKYAFSMPGAGTIKLSELFRQLEISEDVHNVETVEFTDDSLLEITPDWHLGFVGSYDWTIKSLKPFTSNETLTITLKDGKEYIIAVTDAQSVDGSNFITDAQLTIDGVTYGKDDTWVVYPDVDYELKLYFGEKGSRQFPKGGDSITFDLPEGLTIPEGTTGSFDMPAGLAGTIYGNTYKVEGGKLIVTFGEDPEDILTRSSTARFNITFTAQFDEHSGELKFNDSVKPTVNTDEDSNVSVSKTGNYNASTGQMDYVIAVKSTGKSENVKVTDAISGNVITLDQSSIKIDPAAKVSSQSISSNSKGFELTIPEIAHNETVYIRYSADIDFSQIDDSTFTIKNAGTNGKNSIKVENDDGKEDHQDFVYNNQIKYSDVTKSSTRITDAEDKAVLEWKITANENCKGSIVGGHISDTIDYNSKDAMVYKKNSDGTVTLHVVAKDSNGVTKKTYDVNVPVETYNENQEHWTYEIPKINSDKEVLSYEITYETEVTKASMSSYSNGIVKNNTNNDRGGSSSGSGLIPGVGDGGEAGEDSSIVAGKTAKKVTDEYIDWDIVVVVPAEGFSDHFTIVDELPWSYAPGADTLEGEPVITGLTGTESYSWEVTENNDHYLKRDGEPLLTKKLTINFFEDAAKTNPGLTGTGSSRTLTVTIRTKNDQKWMEKALGDHYLDTHTNNAYVNGYHISAEGKPVLSNLVKKGSSTADIDGLPAYYYDIVLSNVSEEPVVLDDYYDSDYFELVPYDSNKIYLPSYYVMYGEHDYDQETGSQILPVITEPEKGHLHIVVNNLDKQEDGSYWPYYRIHYALKVKSSAVLEQMKKDAIDSKGSLKIGNKVQWGDIDDSVDVEYTVPTITKDGYFHDTAKAGSNNRLYDFMIDINPQKMELNGGQPMDLSDTHTNNLTIDYHTVKVYKLTGNVTKDQLKESLRNTASGQSVNNGVNPENYLDNSGTISWNFEGNIGSFYDIPDKEHYVITYSALVIGSGNQSFSNEADLEGFISIKTDYRSFGNDAEGAAEVYQIGLIKYKNGKTSDGLQGATFQLFRGTGEYEWVEENGNRWGVEKKEPMTWGVGTETEGKVGQNITFTSGDDGYVLIALDQTRHGAELEEGVHYYLKEVDSPAGYQIDGSVEYWEFTLTMDPDEVSYGTERDEYNNRKWNYFYYDDILKMSNTPTEEPLTVKVDKNWLDINGNPTTDSNLKAAVQLYQKKNNEDYKAVTRIKGKDGTEYDGRVVLTGKNQWKYVWKDLPRVDSSGNKYAYRLEEVESPEDYASTVTESETEDTKTYAITNQQVRERKTDVSVSKIWKDEKGGNLTTDGLPDTIDFYLYRVVSRSPFTTLPTSGGNKYSIAGESHRISTDDGLYRISKQEYANGITFTNLPSVERDENGIWYFYSYYIKEVPMDGFTSAVSVQEEAGQNDNTVLKETLTNTKLPEPTDIRIRKVWQDETGDVIEAPDKEIQFRLYQVSSSSPFTTLPTSGGKLYDVTQLKSDDSIGNNYTRVSEGIYKLGGYASADTTTWDWDPSYSKWEKVWGVNFKDLPQNSIDAKGKVTYYAYYVTEDAVDNYDSVVTPVLESDGSYTITLTNKYRPETTQLTVDKTWLNKEGSLPLKIDRSNQETTYRIYRVEGDISDGKAIINGDTGNPVDVSSLRKVTVIGSNAEVNTSSLIVRTGDVISVKGKLVQGVDTNWNGWQVKYGPDQNTNSAGQVTLAEDGLSYTATIKIAEDTQYIRAGAAWVGNGGVAEVTVENTSITSVQYTLTQKQASKLSGATEYGEPLTVKGNGTATSKDLPLVSKGKSYTYFLVEDGGDDYNAEYVIDGNTIHVTNREPDMLEVDKTWLDANDNVIEKTDGTITYTLHQLASAIPAPASVTLNTTNLKYGHPEWLEYGWTNVQPQVPVVNLPESPIKAGSKININLKMENTSLWNSSMEGFDISGGNIVSSEKKVNGTVSDNTSITGIIERNIVVDNLEGTLTFSGTIEADQTDNRKLIISITVLEEPANARKEPDNSDTPKDNVLGNIVVGHNSIVSTTVPSDYSVAAGKNPWSAVVSDLPKTGDGNNYTYYVDETALPEGFELVSVSPESATAGGNITITNKKQATGSLKVEKEFSGLTYKEMSDTQKEALSKITFTVNGPNGYTQTISLSDAVKGKTLSDLPVGEYTVTETRPDDSTPEGYIYKTTTVKVDKGSPEEKVTANASIVLDGKETVHFINDYEEEKQDFTLNIIKVRKDHAETKLKDAEFTLRLIDEEVSNLNSIKYKDGNSTVLTTDQDGKASFTELQYGYYEIKETATPAGYVLTGEDSFYIRIDRGGVALVQKDLTKPATEWDVVETFGNVKQFGYTAADKSATVTVENETGVALPKTGGIGTDIFRTIGLMLIAFGTILYGISTIRRRRPVSTIRDAKDNK